jgi:hypothetical protein
MRHNSVFNVLHQMEDSSLSQKQEPTVSVGDANCTFEEYKLLSAHYFHEDNLYQKVTTTFATLNAALLAFARAAPVNSVTVSNKTLGIVGITLCICWCSSLIRIREYRRLAEDRIRIIETLWAELEWDDYRMVPDIRRATRWDALKPTFTWWNWWLVAPYRLFRLVPTSLVMMSLPLAFVIAWVIVYCSS